MPDTDTRTAALAVASMARAQFDALARTGMAGPMPEDLPELTARWREQNPGWRGKHWIYVRDQHGVLRLSPLNLTRTTTATATVVAVDAA